MRRFGWLLLLFLGACTTDIPDVEPAAFSCESDEPLASGELQCPKTHWCDDGTCRPRLGCSEEGKSAPGCDVAAQRRCDPVLNPLTSAVACAGGNQTITSTIPIDAACHCPDQGSAGTVLFCARYAEGPSGGGYPLFLVPAGEALPIGMFGITGEVEDWRVCVRACATEQDCPASHTCRPSVVVSDQLLASPDSRHTIGACYPNLIVPTTTTTVIDQPDEDACLSDEDCPGDCQFNVEIVPDHPSLPIGPDGPGGWKDRKALIGRCVQGTGALAEPGTGCATDAECKNGLCHSGSCQQPCDPFQDSACDVCLAEQVERVVPGGDEPVRDAVHICER